MALNIAMVWVLQQGDGTCGGKRGEWTSEEVNERGRLVLLDERFDNRVSYELRNYLGDG